MNFADFVTRVYSRVPLKHSQTLVQIRELAVQQLAEMASRRVGFMESTAEFTLPVAEPYGGEWAGPGLSGFPLDLLEVDGAYYGIGDAGWSEIEGPVDIEVVRTRYFPVVIAPPALSLYPSCFAWWNGRFWVTRVGGDIAVKLDYFRDGTRDEVTGVKIVTDSTKETNGWLKRGANALEYAVLAAYFALPLSTDQEQVQICNAQTNAYLSVIDTETNRKTGTSFRAPVCFPGGMPGDRSYPSWRQ